MQTGAEMGFVESACQISEAFLSASTPDEMVQYGVKGAQRHRGQRDPFPASFWELRRHIVPDYT